MIRGALGAILLVTAACGADGGACAPTAHVQGAAHGVTMGPITCVAFRVNTSDTHAEFATLSDGTHVLELSSIPGHMGALDGVALDGTFAHTNHGDGCYDGSFTAAAPSTLVATFTAPDDPQAHCP
jgi:hypothetical protein